MDTPVEMQMDEKETRVIGCLIEKQLATPEYYPLSLNALTNACNQKTNREPVTDYDESVVSSVLDALVDKKLVNKSTVGRVPKFEELLTQQHNMVPQESAILCVLFLRGPQTIGEIRSRTSRLCNFESSEAVMAAMANLESWGMVQRLARQPGHKESRYAQLLSTAPQTSPAEEISRPPLSSTAGPDTRFAEMEAQIQALKHEVADLREMFDQFKAQFE
jgi:hypothetical protein